MAYSEASKKATYKYRKENYTTISFDVKKETKESYKRQAEKYGLPLNTYIRKLIEEDIEKNGEQK